MDLTIDVEDYKLNIRGTCIIVHNNKILVHKSQKSDHYALLGGRVKIGETSEETVKREVKEETGKEIDLIGYVGTVENFFEANNSKYHEIMFIYQAEFKNEEDKLIQETIKNAEGKDYLNYEWLDIEKLDEYKLLPKAVKSIVKVGVYPVHVINNEL